MRFKSLKTNIYVNLAILLLLAIGLSDLVLIRIIESQLIEHRLAETKQWLFSVSSDSIPQQTIAAGYDRNVVCLSTRSADGQSSGFGIAPGSLQEPISDLSRQVLLTGQPAHRFWGHVWGIFWLQSKYLAVAVPTASMTGAAVAVVDLQPIYRSLRFSQKIVFFYLVINFIILLHIGAFRLTRLVTRPIQRLIKVTETYDSPDRFNLFSPKQDDEFGRLSSALSRMVNRIEQDKWMLQKSLDSIETANRELKCAQQEVVRAEKLASTGRLSAGIAHEIGNPIGIVLGYLGLLKNRSLTPETAADYIGRAETEINRINSIIRQLLDFSRVAPEAFCAFSLHDLLREAGEMLSRQPMMKTIRIQYDLSAPCDNVFADYNQLHQVIVNLLINAADSIAAGNAPDSGIIDLITLSGQPEGGIPMVELLVRDNGCGIPSDAIDRIFDPFFTTKEPGKGTGLGLSVSYMIIERFGGNIEAKSNSGAGTTMAIRLPLADSENKAAQCGS